MKSIFLSTAGAVALLALPSAVMAQDSGWYVGGNVGAGKHLDSDLSGGLLGNVDGEGALSGNLNVGYDFGNNWRLELEGGEVNQDVLGKIGNSIGSKASARTSSYMINALYDFDDFERWKPYIGAGIGMFDTSLRAIAHGAPINEACSIVGATECKLAGSDAKFGWQAMAGADYKITDNLDWTNQVKYFNAGEMDFVGNRTAGGNDLNVALGSLAGVAALTGLRYRFGGQPAVITSPPPPPPPPPPPAPLPAPVAAAPAPAPTYNCWDGSVVFDTATCPAEPVREVVEPTTYTCWDGSLVYDQSQCSAPVVQEVVASYNNCGPSPVAIFNVDLSQTPKPLNRLGTMPEFGDSHDLSPSQFFEKLQSHYAANENGDRAYLNYLFKSMGYSNGFRDADSSMFSNDVLPIGTTGLLGLGKVHHYAYHVLPNNDRDRQAFRIQSANGTVIHFMKTCGNYMYSCN